MLIFIIKQTYNTYYDCRIQRWTYVEFWISYFNYSANELSFCFISCIEIKIKIKFCVGRYTY